MHDDLKLETRDKVLQKMSRNGAVEENVSRGTTKSVSGRIAEITFEKEAAPGSDLEWGRGAKASGGEKRKHKGYGKHSSEAYLDSLLAQVGVESTTYKTDSGVNHSVVVQMADVDRDLSGKYESTDKSDIDRYIPMNHQKFYMSINPVFQRKAYLLLRKSYLKRQPIKAG